MNRIEQVLNVIRSDSTREWSPADVSVILKVAPAVAGNPMRKLADQGVLIRSARGLYRLATPAEIAERERAQRAVPVVAAIPAPAPVKAPPITEGERILILRTLRAQGRPMAPALIAGRLGKCGIRLARADQLLAMLAQEDVVRQLENGRWELIA